MLLIIFVYLSKCIFSYSSGWFYLYRKLPLCSPFVINFFIHKCTLAMQPYPAVLLWIPHFGPGSLTDIGMISDLSHLTLHIIPSPTHTQPSQKGSFFTPLTKWTTDYIKQQDTPRYFYHLRSEARHHLGQGHLPRPCIAEMHALLIHIFGTQLLFA